MEERGIWEKIHNALHAKVRTKAGKDVEPSVGIIDSQSVKITCRGGEHGFDGGKKVNGRKRHIITDTLGLLIVHSAGIQDREGTKLVLKKLALRKISRLRLIFADCGYTGNIISWTKEQFNLLLQIVKRPLQSKGFVLLPKRWIVERTFSWFNQYRRLSKEYEYFPDSSEAMINLMLNRLAPK